MDIYFGISHLGQGSPALWKQCDKYMSCFTLLRTLHMLDIDDVKVKLTDLSDPSKMRAVRDVLLNPRIDRIHLALQVCRTCSIEEDPVYSAWGLALVRVGLYEDARKKFAQSLGKSSGENRKDDGGFGNQNDAKTTSSETVKQVVRQIVNMIKANSKGMGIAELRRRHKVLSIEVMARKVWNANLNIRYDNMPKSQKNDATLLPLELQQECLYYLETYSMPNGDSQELVAFYVSQDMIKEACKVVVSQHLSTKVFVDIVVTACIENDRAIELQNVLGSIDSSLNLVRHYLIGMCNWLSLHQKHLILKDVQVFMKDHIGAAFTCERLFHKATGFDEQMGNLRQVKEHFAAALSQGETRVNSLSLEGTKEFAENPFAIKSRIKLIDHQMSVLKLFPSNKIDAIFTVGVALRVGEKEEEKNALEEKRLGILEKIRPIDPHLHSQLLKAFDM